MASIKRRLLFFLLLLFFFFLEEAKAEMEGTRVLRQFEGDSKPSYASRDSQPPPLPFSFDLTECKEQPEIPNAKVRCGYSGCRVRCDKDYKTQTGLSVINLSCDHSSGTLTVDGTPWRDLNVSCTAYCGVDGCLHGGTCTNPRTCSCLDGYQGDHCEIAPETPVGATPASGDPQTDPNSCPDPSFVLQNAEVKREGQNLLVRCQEGHVFKIGKTIAFVTCKEGVWDLPDGVLGPAGEVVCVESQCDPPCQNGGKCLEEKVCDCPYKFWGGHCEHQRCGYPDPKTLGAASLGGVLSRMKIQCHPHHRMINGRRTQTILCRGGEWYASGRGYLRDTDVKCHPEDNTPNWRPSP
ncbi:von Willebrand factor D and EGF domain-containing protein-like [Eriocheir sinensis]|uniref:von Willebrand factor D and EGF domain-containing protein-like n=1 Tax=Eriocheir sinensis TaxID=95602 RepID=UPI0021C7DAB8|nr:von Willebrand factor D and EGF domain-containing protein-like [Eriocheir sinensis]